MTPEAVYHHPGALRLARSTPSPRDALQAAALRVLESRPATWGAWWVCVRGGVLNWCRSERRAPRPTEDGMPPEPAAHPEHAALEAASDVRDLLVELHAREHAAALEVLKGNDITARDLRALRTAARRWAKENASHD